MRAIGATGSPSWPRNWAKISFVIPAEALQHRQEVHTQATFGFFLLFWCGPAALAGIAQVYSGQMGRSDFGVRWSWAAPRVPFLMPQH
jgi:hypothetical protein